MTLSTDNSHRCWNNFILVDKCKKSLKFKIYEKFVSRFTLSFFLLSRFMNFERKCDVKTNISWGEGFSNIFGIKSDVRLERLLTHSNEQQGQIGERRTLPLFALKSKHHSLKCPARFIVLSSENIYLFFTIEHENLNCRRHSRPKKMIRRVHDIQKLTLGTRKKKPSKRFYSRK